MDELTAIQVGTAVLENAGAKAEPDLFGIGGLEDAVLNDIFAPSLLQSVKFAEATKDSNWIHRKIENYDEVISPGLMQDCISFVYIRKAMEALGVKPEAYPYSVNESEMPSLVITGFPYEVKYGFKRSSMSADVELKNRAGNLVSRLASKFYAFKPELLKKEEELSREYGEHVYEGRFGITDYSDAETFRELVKSNSEESNLMALAGSSSAVCTAINEGKLNLPPKVVAMYSGTQKFYLDSHVPVDLKNGINLKLYVSDREKFGKLSGKNDSVGIFVSGEEDSGRVIYQWDAKLSFKEDRLIQIAMRRAGVTRRE